MAVPKRRTSKSRKRLRRGHHAAAGIADAGVPPLRIAQALRIGSATRAATTGARSRSRSRTPERDPRRGGRDGGRPRPAGGNRRARCRRSPASPDGRSPSSWWAARPRSRPSWPATPTPTAAASSSTRRLRSSAWPRSRSPPSARSPTPASWSASACRRAAASDAFVSAGNTGATLAASTVLLGLHDGVERATVATLFPTASHAGARARRRAPTSTAPPASWSASPTSAPSTCATCWAGPSPTVGLLNVGEEEEKGNAIVREAHQLLKQRAPAPLRRQHRGARHPRRAPAADSRCDVVVCDGFVGNVVLKFYESVGPAVRRACCRSGSRTPSSAPRCRTSIQLLDYSEYGGAPLLGVKGVSIICHGSSRPTPSRTPSGVAVQSVRGRL